MFAIANTPDLYRGQGNALKLAHVVRKWGYRARVWTRPEGFCVAIYSNNGFEGFAHAL